MSLLVNRYKAFVNQKRTVKIDLIESDLEIDL
jgi:hypothetical protein